MIITVKVLPKSSQNSVVGWENEMLKVKLNAPPDKGKANAALIELLSDYYSVPKSSIEILSGHTSRIKRVSIAQKEVKDSKKDEGRTQCR